MTIDRAKADLLGFVRGERTAEVLERLGARLKYEPTLRAEFPAGLPVVEVAPNDLATGFAKVLDDPVASRRWAFVVLASDVELAKVADRRTAEILLDALWTVSGGDEVSAEARAVIKACAADQPGVRSGDGLR